MNIGCDIVKVSRFANVNNSFIEKILSDEEIKIYIQRKDKVSFLAGRFALKEAIIKTFSGKEEVLMNEISIINDVNGRPICKYKNYEILGTIAHEKEYAIAYAIRKED